MHLGGGLGTFWTGKAQRALKLFVQGHLLVSKVGCGFLRSLAARGENGRGRQGRPTIVTIRELLTK